MKRAVILIAAVALACASPAGAMFQFRAVQKAMAHQRLLCGGVHDACYDPLLVKPVCHGPMVGPWHGKATQWLCDGYVHEQIGGACEVQSGWSAWGKITWTSKVCYGLASNATRR